MSKRRRYFFVLFRLFCLFCAWRLCHRKIETHIQKSLQLLLIRLLNRNANPVCLAHMIGGIYPLVAAKRRYEHCRAFEIDNGNRFVYDTADLRPFQVHHERKPLFADGVAEHGVCWTVSPREIRLNPVCIAYILFKFVSCHFLQRNYYKRALILFKTVSVSTLLVCGNISKGETRTTSYACDRIFKSRARVCGLQLT